VTIAALLDMAIELARLNGISLDLLATTMAAAAADEGQGTVQ
jgi:hypothetical protein